MVYRCFGCRHQCRWQAGPVYLRLLSKGRGAPHQPVIYQPGMTPLVFRYLRKRLHIMESLIRDSAHKGIFLITTRMATWICTWLPMNSTMLKLQSGSVQRLQMVRRETPTGCIGTMETRHLQMYPRSGRGIRRMGTCGLYNGYQQGWLAGCIRCQ